MKAKIFSFIGLVIASIGASVFFAATPVHAAGEQYTWIDEDTIVGVGGAYGGFIPDLGTVGRVELKRIRDNSLIYQVSGSDARTRCDFNITIIFNVTDPSKGTLQVDGCHDSPTAVELYKDRNVNLQNPDRGPPPVSDIGEDTECGESDDQCNAVQACIENGQSQAECLDEWSGCISDNNTPAECREQVGTADNTTTCAIDQVGWILCPIANFLAGMADGAYGIVSSLLAVQPLLTTGTSEPVYQAWSIMRNFANVAFVIAFLFIIFSQITSIGISNYGIKRMLPRLIIAAILVNISYWVCAIAVDISNVLGGSLKSVFDSIGGTLETPEFSDSQTGAGWEGIVGVVLAGSAVLVAFQYVTYAALFPILITVVAAIVTTFIVLALRQALIILLVVISPLAFVAYLLPNTESWFSKWRNFFQTLLLMYPIIGLLFGASALASQIVTNSAASVDQPQKIVVQIMGAGIAVIPLLITPVFFKALSSVLERFGVNDPSKGIVDRARNKAGGFRDTKQGIMNARRGNQRLQRRKTILEGKEDPRIFGRSILGEAGSRRRRATEAVMGEAGSTQRRVAASVAGLGVGVAAKRNAELEGSKRELGRAQGELVAEEAQRSEAFRGKLAGGGGEGAESRALAGAISTQAKLEAEEVTAASAVIKNLNLDRNLSALSTLAEKGKVGNLNGEDRAVRAAAVKYMVDSHDVTGVNNLLDKVSADPTFMDQKMRESFADSLATSSEKPTYVGQSAISNLRRHGEEGIRSKSSIELAKDAIKANAYSAEKIATGDQDELSFIAKVAQQPDVDNSTIKANAVKAQEDDRLNARISKNRPAVEAIANTPAPSDSAPPQPIPQAPSVENDRDEKWRYL